MPLFLHSADWQIGKPYARVHDPDKRARLRQVRLEAIDRIGAAARAHGASFLVVAGDLFDSPTPSSSDVSAVCQAIGRLEIPVLVIPGNHDHGAPGSVWHGGFFQTERQRRAPNLRLLLERQPLELEQAVLLPCPLLRRSEAEDPCGWVRQLDWASLPAGKARILLAHGSVHGFGGADLDADEENPAASGNRLHLGASLLEQVDYVALGDWHGLKQVNAKSWYAGTPEPDRFPRSSDYQGGQVLLVEAERGAPPRVEPLPTGQLRWLPLRVHFTGDGDLERFEGQLEQLLGDALRQDLLLLEESGGLSLEGHQRYEALLERLEAQLLRLKRRGRCVETPAEAELAQLTGRPGDPLIARVAAGLQSDLLEAGNPEAQANGAPASEGPDDPAALIRRALGELHRCLQAAERG
ncbi:DNA repair exonuclease [Vulcanococcus limneticus Candia 3F8]|uniref:metallophosphoesterase family protein n=1 Tax=Vulcanococcus limneticus TaxID=2170428 RepID=UPI000B995274|nr:DNA repair exonuclease [Vulcanococcus limneticus]MCP9791009.1 DNA repair exonuclease [Vulcanococcus limneticus MW73D5]MCP9892233.1 DNA repair exonuclease [Vulcanococcus limneticus Candia 3F8]MCP9895945.1 DNA repair exonuclease [Vulcanococcus limneticus Candia 3B3]